MRLSTGESLARVRAPPACEVGGSGGGRGAGCLFDAGGTYAPAIPTAPAVAARGPSGRPGAPPEPMRRARRRVVRLRGKRSLFFSSGGSGSAGGAPTLRWSSCARCLRITHGGARITPVPNGPLEPPTPDRCKGPLAPIERHPRNRGQLQNLRDQIRLLRVRLLALWGCPFQSPGSFRCRCVHPSRANTLSLRESFSFF